MEIKKQNKTKNQTIHLPLSSMTPSSVSLLFVSSEKLPPLKSLLKLEDDDPLPLDPDDPLPLDPDAPLPLEPDRDPLPLLEELQLPRNRRPRFRPLSSDNLLFKKKTERFK